jgi:nitrite reductase (NADH) small subunit
MDGWTEFCRLDEVPRLGARVACTRHGPVAVFRTRDDHVFALRDSCPHRGGPLSQGIVHGHRVTCPLHDWMIELGTGRAVAPDEGAVVTYPVRIEDGAVFVRLDPVAATAEAQGA